MKKEENKNYLKLRLFLISITLIVNFSHAADVTIIGYSNFNDGLGRLPITIADMLHKKLTVKFINAQQPNNPNLPAHLKKLMRHYDHSVSPVTLFAGTLWSPSENYLSLIPDSKIKLAYSMFETSAIPEEWVSVLNNQFDAVVVPDQFLVEVYTGCGVTIPIFVLPCPLYLEEFLETTPKCERGCPFVFGVSSTFLQRKNIALLTEAFLSNFENNPEVELKIHARNANKESLKDFAALKKRFSFQNIELIYKPLPQEEYVKFISSLDAYVLPSKGEGFSITPREAMAAGVPCIITDNSAHHTICATGFVRPVHCNIIKPAYSDLFERKLGIEQSCLVKELQYALADVYANYDHYLSLTHYARQWSKQFTRSYLCDSYLSLIKPKKIILGSENTVTKTFLKTNSVKLFNKYQEAFETK